MYALWSTSLLRSNVDSQQSHIVNSWNPKAISHYHTNNYQHVGCSTLGSNIIERAGYHLSMFFDPDVNWSVLEVMAGNGAASKILQKFLCYQSWIQTDIWSYFPQSDSD